VREVWSIVDNICWLRTSDAVMSVVDCEKVESWIGDFTHAAAVAKLLTFHVGSSRNKQYYEIN